MRFAKAGSFSEAPMELYIPQPCLSAMVKKTEVMPYGIQPVVHGFSPGLKKHATGMFFTPATQGPASSNPYSLAKRIPTQRVGILFAVSVHFRYFSSVATNIGRP